MMHERRDRFMMRVFLFVCISVLLIMTVILDAIWNPSSAYIDHLEIAESSSGPDFDENLFDRYLLVEDDDRHGNGPNEGDATNGPTYFGYTRSPSHRPTELPSPTPSLQPTTLPSGKPSLTPSFTPTSAPSSLPTSTPTLSPSRKPSHLPTTEPSLVPSLQPTMQPTGKPSFFPSGSPSLAPSATPSLKPSTLPTVLPSGLPSSTPSITPTSSPSLKPSYVPTGAPSLTPSLQPTTPPTGKPSLSPSRSPSLLPSSIPSLEPSATPTLMPSSIPSSEPSLRPSSGPSAEPTVKPSFSPTALPSLSPSSAPSSYPTSIPSVSPSFGPTASPSLVPSGHPSSAPSSQPSLSPSTAPSSQPSLSPSTAPSSSPSSVPSIFPTSLPSKLPTTLPTTQPSSLPSSFPSVLPSSAPSLDPCKGYDGTFGDTNGENAVTISFLYGVESDKAMGTTLSDQVKEVEQAMLDLLIADFFSDCETVKYNENRRLESHNIFTGGPSALSLAEEGDDILSVGLNVRSVGSAAPAATPTITITSDTSFPSASPSVEKKTSPNPRNVIVGLASSPVDLANGQRCLGDFANNPTVDAECNIIQGRLTAYLTKMDFINVATTNIPRSIKTMMDAGRLDDSHPAILSVSFITNARRFVDVPDEDIVEETIPPAGNRNTIMFAAGGVSVLFVLAVVTRYRYSRQFDESGRRIDSHDDRNSSEDDSSEFVDMMNSDSSNSRFSV